MTARQRQGFTLVEILIVVVIMAVLAATIIPQFTNSAQDARINTALFNLHSLRAQIQLYKTDHDGLAPATLDLLTEKTDRSGAIDAAGPYGPYIHDVPANPLVDGDAASQEEAVTATPTAATSSGKGWLYNSTTGEVWINTDPYVEE